MTALRHAARGPALGILLFSGCLGGRKADVIYVPSATDVVERMLSLARVAEGDLVYDLGCGDGRIVIAAARDRGARGVCNDIDPARIAESRRNAEAAGVTDQIRLDQGDLFDLDLGPATVVAVYLSPAINLRLRPKLLRELRPGARVISHNFDMGEWRPDSTVRVAWPTGTTSTVHLWVLPADAAGTWELTAGMAGTNRRYRIRLEQQFQQLSGTASAAGRPIELNASPMSGDTVVFTLADTVAGAKTILTFRGRVSGGRMQGEVPGPKSRPAPWRAVRPY